MNIDNTWLSHNRMNLPTQYERRQEIMTGRQTEKKTLEQFRPSILPRRGFTTILHKRTLRSTSQADRQKLKAKQKAAARKFTLDCHEGRGKVV